MAKSKKASNKTITKSVPKKVVSPLDAPRLKVPEDDLPAPGPTTFSGLLKGKLSSLWVFIVKNKVKVGVVLVVVVVGGWALSNYLDTRDQLNKLANPKTSSQTEIKIITDQIQGAIDLPQETPTLATVSDVERLKAQVFFKNAENGDKVLIYPQTCKAILYRTTTKKIIALMSACGNDNNAQSSNTTQQSQQNTQAQQPVNQPTAQPTPTTNR